MKFFYSDVFELPLPPEHRYPNSKYRLLRDYLIDNDLLRPNQLEESPLADPEWLQLAHTKEYIEAVLTGTLTVQEVRRIGFPWSPQLARRSLATVGGAVAAAQEALVSGISGQLAGGTHHAHSSFGSGYCVFNDFAVVALKLLRDHGVHRVAIIDLDVHQGDGNAAILSQNENVFTLSVHGEKNFPFRKFASTLDIALPDGTGDEVYLEALMPALRQVEAFSPDFLLFQTGVDGLKEDTLGRLSLTLEGLRQRDELVFAFARRIGVPLSMAIGGGYCKPIDRTIEAYAQTYAVMRRFYS